MKPPCMSDAEYLIWAAYNRALYACDRADSPCADCTDDYAAEMRLVALCDGIPNDVKAVDNARRERALRALEKARAARLAQREAARGGAIQTA